MSAISNYAADKILQEHYRTATGTGGTIPAAVYVALLESAATAGSTGSTIVEPTGNGYARVQVAQLDASWTAPATVGNNREITNAAQIDFPDATGDYTNPVTHFALVDAVTGGNLLRSAALDNPRSPVNGGKINFPAGTLKIQEEVII